MYHLVILKPLKNGFRTFKFASKESAQQFVKTHNFESKVVDLFFWI